jgi:diamine N-acetyltransferase
LPAQHVNFFLQEYQTAAAIQKQVLADYEYYLLEDDGNALGYLGLQLATGKIVISKLYLLKNYRRLGWGNEALHFTCNRALQLKAKKIQLVVHRNNNNAIRFYRQHGFEITKPLVHSFENGYAVEDYLMTKAVAII